MNTEKSTRLISLDALRGFDMLWIIGGENVIRHLAKASDFGFLNVLASQMHHVKWEGFRFYDLIMPLFLFMVGMSIPFSYSKRLSIGDSKKKIYLHALKRSVILFVLGMVCQCHLLSFDINQMHIIHDTLQAIAIGYMFSVLIFSQLKLKFQFALTAGLILLYWIILTFIPVPGQQPGVLLPQSNIAKFVEQMVFGRFDDGPAPYTWFLGSLGFVATVMTGVFASTIIRGKIRLSFLKNSDPQIHKTIILSLTGGAMVVVALILSIWYPVIKPLWNPTFVILTSGISFLLITLFYFIIDVRGYQRWAFWLKVIGMNSIAVYMGVHLINFEEIAQHLVFGLEQFTNMYYPFIQSLTGLAIIYVILYWMYKKGTFIKV
jgi:predicted acyltransferase